MGDEEGPVALVSGKDFHFFHYALREPGTTTPLLGSHRDALPHPLLLLDQGPIYRFSTLR